MSVETVRIRSVERFSRTSAANSGSFCHDLTTSMGTPATLAARRGEPDLANSVAACS